MVEPVGSRGDLFSLFLVYPVVDEEELVEELRSLLRSRCVDGRCVLRGQMTTVPGRVLDPLVQHLVDGSAKTLEEAKPT